jgi:SAM-dependent methyltransferase
LAQVSLQASSSNGALANIEKAERLLAEAHTIDQALFLKGMLKEAEVQARKKGLMDIQILAARYEILVMQKIGQILQEMKTKGELAKGGEPFRKSERHGFNEISNKDKHPRKPRNPLTHPSEKSRGDLNTKPRRDAKTVKQLGLSWNESSEAQKLARKSPEELQAEMEAREQRIRERAARKAGERLSAISEEDLQRVEARAQKIAEDSVHEVYKEILAEERAEETRKEFEQIAGRKELPGLVQVYNGDFRNILPEKVRANSIDLILTDPPYERKYLDLWEALGVEAKRVLKDGGYLVTYSPHYILPLVLNTLGKYLDFYHPCGTLHTSQQSLFWSKNFKARWKPILIFSKGKGRKHRQMFDFLIGEKGEKYAHPWSQSVSEARYFIQNMTDLNGVVLDPMCGMGTVLRASFELGRHSIGIDIEKENCVLTEGFVKEALR